LVISNLLRKPIFLYSLTSRGAGRRRSRGEKILDWGREAKV
jgi:hypothetical protein